MSAHLFKAASLGLSFALNIFIARILPGQQAGTFMTMMVVLPALSMVGRCGTDVFALRYSRSGSRDVASPHVRGMPYRQLTVIALLGSLTVAIVGALLLVSFGTRFMAAAGVPAMFAVPVIASVPLHALSVLDSAVLRAAGRFGLAPFLELGLAQAVAVLVVYPVSLVAGSMFLSFSFALLLGLVVTAAISRWAVRRSLGSEPPRNCEVVTVRPMAWIAIGGIAYYGWTWLPVLCAWLALGASDAGIAIAILKYVALLNLVQVVQLNALLPKVARMKNLGRIGSISQLMRNQLLRAAPLNTGLALGLALLSRPLMQAYGGAYAAHSALLAETAIAFGIVWSIFGLVVPVAAVVGEARQTTVWTCCATTAALVSLVVVGHSLLSVMVTYVLLTAALMAVLTVVVKKRVGCSIALGWR